jgi:hypothetical protein
MPSTVNISYKHKYGGVNISYNQYELTYLARNPGFAEVPEDEWVPHFS